MVEGLAKSELLRGNLVASLHAVVDIKQPRAIVLLVLHLLLLLLLPLHLSLLELPFCSPLLEPLIDSS
jgi:hypothetical protein